MGVHPPETGAVKTDGSGHINGATVSTTSVVSARLFFFATALSVLDRAIRESRRKTDYNENPHQHISLLSELAFT
ncbi:MAG: hypothetical protein CMM04_11620 [Rhodopirellula sp.]|nr:hypothetical protein [Rhodopirellula sp.]